MSEEPTVAPATLTGAELQAAALTKSEDLGRLSNVSLRQRLQKVAFILGRLPANPTGPSLIILSPGADSLPVVQPLVGAMLTVGRSAACGYALPDDTKLSRCHFQITKDEEDYQLQDLDSSNGTFLYGQEHALTRHLLCDGDLFHAGRHEFLFWLGRDHEED